MKNITARLNKTKIVITPLEENDEVSYWQSKTVEERLKGIETNRSLIYGYGNNPPRLQRFFEVVEQTWC